MDLDSDASIAAILKKLFLWTHVVFFFRLHLSFHFSDFRNMELRKKEKGRLPVAEGGPARAPPRLYCSRGRGRRQHGTLLVQIAAVRF